MNEQTDITSLYYQRFKGRNNEIKRRDLQWGWTLRAIGDMRSFDSLDIGSGSGKYSIAMKDRFQANCSALDLFPEPPLNLSELDIDYRQGSADSLPWSDNRFDLVLALSVIFYLPNPAEGISEIARVLKPGGRAIISGHTLYSWPTAYRLILRRLRPSKVKHLDGVVFRDVDYYLNAINQAELNTVGLGGFSNRRQLNFSVPNALTPYPRNPITLMSKLIARHRYHFIIEAKKPV